MYHCIPLTGKKIQKDIQGTAGGTIYKFKVKGTVVHYLDVAENRGYHRLQPGFWGSRSRKTPEWLQKTGSITSGNSHWGFSLHSEALGMLQVSMPELRDVHHYWPKRTRKVGSYMFAIISRNQNKQATEVFALKAGTFWGLCGGSFISPQILLEGKHSFPFYALLGFCCLLDQDLTIVGGKNEFIHLGRNELSL